MGYAGIKTIQEAVKNKAKALKPPIIKENVIQKNVAKLLDYLSDNNQKFFWWHTPNNVRTNIVTATKFKADGVKAGVPDCTIIHKGKTYYIELKTEVGRLSKSQKALFPILEKHGANISVCRNTEEVTNQLKEWKII